MLSRLKTYRVKVYGKPSERVVFFFCPFGARRWQFLLPWLPVKRLMRAGFQVVCYDFNTAIGRKGPAHALEVVKAVEQDVERRVTGFRKRGVTHLSCFGVSMGTLFAAYSAAHNPSIKKVVLNLSYSDIADHILNFPGMVFLPKRSVKKWIRAAGGVKEIKDVTAPYSPLTYVDKLSKKRVLLYLSRKDRVLRYPSTSQLKYALEQLNTDLTYIENPRHGHYITASINNIKSSVYIPFLSK